MMTLSSRAKPLGRVMPLTVAVAELATPSSTDAPENR